MNIYFTLGFILTAFIAGWTTCTWYEGYKGEHAAIVAENRAATGETKIIHDTQVITKVVYREKDNCIQKPMPTDVISELR